MVYPPGTLESGPGRERDEWANELKIFAEDVQPVDEDFLKKMT